MNTGPVEKMAGKEEHDSVSFDSLCESPNMMHSSVRTTADGMEGSCAHLRRNHCWKAE